MHIVKQSLVLLFQTANLYDDCRPNASAVVFLFTNSVNFLWYRETFAI